MKLNKYYIRARLFPALITCIPAIVLYYFLIGTRAGEIISYVIALPILMHLTIGMALVYAFVLANRFIGKEVFQRIYFEDEKQMPTTIYLLSSDQSLSTDMKRKIKQKINSDFSIKLPTPADEISNIDDAKRQIAFAVSQVRNKTRDNQLLLQHNYEYGFIRNFLGGSIMSVIICLVNIIVFQWIKPNSFALIVSISLGGLFVVFLSISKWLIVRHAKNYAHVLFEQYLYH